MKTIKFKKDCKFSPDGMQVNEYSKDDKAELSDAAAEVAVSAGLALIVEKKKDVAPVKKVVVSAPENKSAPKKKVAKKKNG